MATKLTPIDAAARSDSGLPDFKHPPVDEVALSMQYAPITGFGVPHFGLFWERIRAEYPRFEVQAAIPSVTEHFGPGSNLGHKLGLELVDIPEVRCWYLDETGVRLIQVQRDRFVHNWRKVSGAEAYPRYPELRERLERTWGEFCDFLRHEKLDRPTVNQCEVTYVNHIEYGKGWGGFGELDKVVATLATPKSKNRFLPEPERITMNVVYPLGENMGRLYVAFNPAVRPRDGKEILRMTLTARGAPKSSSQEDVFAWLDMARKWVVRGFADFTTDTMHKVWGMQ